MLAVIPGREPCDKIDASINFALGERTRNLRIPRCAIAHLRSTLAHVPEMARQDNGWVLAQKETRARRRGVSRLPACAHATGDAYRADPDQGADRDDVAARHHPLDRLPSRARDGEPHLAR